MKGRREMRKKKKLRYIWYNHKFAMMNVSVMHCKHVPIRIIMFIEVLVCVTQHSPHDMAKGTTADLDLCPCHTLGCLPETDPPSKACFPSTRSS